MLTTPRILFLFWKLIGLAPVQLHKMKNGSVVMKFSPLGVLYNIILFSIYTSLFCCSILMNLNNKESNNVIYSHQTALAAIILDSVTLMLAGITAVIKSGWQCCSVYKLSLNLNKIDQNLNYKYNNFKLSYLTLSWLIYITILIISDRFVSHISNFTIYFIPLLIGYYHLSSIWLQFIEVVFNINDRFKIINKKVQNLITSNGGNKYDYYINNKIFSIEDIRGLPNVEVTNVDVEVIENKNNRNGISRRILSRKIKFTYNKNLHIYGLLLLSVCTAINFYTMYFDYSRFLQERKFHMKSTTSLIAVSLETISMTLFLIISIIISNSNYNRMIKYEKYMLYQNILFENKCDGEIWYKIIYCLFIWINIVLAGDLFVWFVTTGDMYANIPYSIIVIAFLICICQFAINVFNIGSNFYLVNEFLMNLIPDGNHYLQTKLTMSRKFTASKSQVLTIPMLSDLHWMLCNTVQTTNSIFGGQILAAMLCIFVHIIITPYFFFLDILYPSNDGFLNASYLIVQGLWIVTHVMELILLVVPCAATTSQANRTSTIICKLLNKEMSSETRRQLETFLMQLVHHNAEFSACGLFRLNLPVITSVAGAVTTYLVILIQFQNSDSSGQV